MAEFALSKMIDEIKSVQVKESRKGNVMSCSEVRKSLEYQKIFMMPSKMIPEMGISEESGIEMGL